MKARLSSSPEARVSVLALPGRGGSGSRQCVLCRSVLWLSTHDPNRHVLGRCIQVCFCPPKLFQSNRWDLSCLTYRSELSQDTMSYPCMSLLGKSGCLQTTSAGLKAGHAVRVRMPTGEDARWCEIFFAF